jgi:hypothetical protein
MAVRVQVPPRVLSSVYIYGLLVQAGFFGVVPLFNNFLNKLLRKADLGSTFIEFLDAQAS